MRGPVEQSAHGTDPTAEDSPEENGQCNGRGGEQESGEEGAPGEGEPEEDERVEIEEQIPCDIVGERVGDPEEEHGEYDEKQRLHEGAEPVHEPNVGCNLFHCGLALTRGVDFIDHIIGIDDAEWEKFPVREERSEVQSPDRRLHSGGPEGTIPEAEGIRNLSQCKIRKPGTIVKAFRGKRLRFVHGLPEWRVTADRILEPFRRWEDGAGVVPRRRRDCAAG